MKKLQTIEMGANIWKLFSDEPKSGKYRQHYTESTLWEKLSRTAKSAGMKVVYPVLLLQYLMKSDDVSLKTKLIISAALGYFILPIDFIPDFAPLIGFTDDVGVLLLILRQMATKVTPEIKKNAREHLHKWFGETDEVKLDHLDQEFASGKN
ncbi:MAG: YkvA family protein [Bacteroidota bacterium]|nr:YkvA family protein [Bacteroidota bacterium]